MYFSSFTSVVFLILENSDDEYRILRQNLFERFASNAAVPVEAPIVPVTAAQPRPKKAGATPDRRMFHLFFVFFDLAAYFTLSRCSNIATAFKFPD